MFLRIRTLQSSINHLEQRCLSNTILPNQNIDSIAKLQTEVPILPFFSASLPIFLIPFL